jgi:DNA-binding transcriptional regulator YiaG
VVDLLAELIEADLQRAIARRPVPTMDGPSDIARLRRAVRLTQADFARALGVSVWTLRAWEQGRRRPKGSARTVLQVMAREPRLLLARYTPRGSSTSRSTSSRSPR